MNYFKIIENGEEKYLKTKVSIVVIDLMLKQYMEIPVKTRKSKYNFQKYLFKHGIDCIYDGTVCTFNIDE